MHSSARALKRSSAGALECSNARALESWSPHSILRIPYLSTSEYRYDELPRERPRFVVPGERAEARFVNKNGETAGRGVY